MAPPNKANPYMLSHVSASSTEALRLHEQYFAFRDNVLDGKCLHWSIPESCLEAHGTVADIGTGTGIYLNDVAKQHPSAKHLVGFDVNAAAFMKQLEPGVELIEHDCTKPFEERWRGYFDVVNIRVLAYALTGEQWRAVLEGVSFILKSGGYFQWIESETQNVWDANSNPEVSQALELIMIERRDRGLVEHMPSFMLQSILSNPSLELDFCTYHAKAMLAADRGIQPAIREEDMVKFRETSYRALRALVQSRVHRMRGLVDSGTDEAEAQQHARQAEEAEEVGRAFEGKKDVMDLGIRFPLLVARKRGGEGGDGEVRWVWRSR